MSFRSNRNAKLIDLNINYLPILTKSYTYSFLNFYPYATQSNGEMGGSAELMYKFKKETFFGGKYGTNISINFSRLNSIDMKAPSDTSAIGVSGGELMAINQIFSNPEMNYITRILMLK